MPHGVEASAAENTIRAPRRVDLSRLGRVDRVVSAPAHEQVASGLASQKVRAAVSAEHIRAAAAGEVLDRAEGVPFASAAAVTCGEIGDDARRAELPGGGV